MQEQKHNLIQSVFRILKIVWNFDKKVILYIFSFRILINLLILLSSWYTAKFLNYVTSTKLDSILNQELIFIILVYISIPLVQNSIYVWQSYLRGKFSVDFVRYTFDTLYLGKKGELDIQTLENAKFNSQQDRVNQNFHKLDNGFWLIVDAFDYIFNLVLSLIVIGFYNWVVVLVLILATLPDMYLEIKYGRRKWGIWSMNGELRKRWQEFRRPFITIGGLLDLKLYQTANYFLEFVVKTIKNFNVEIIENERQRTIRKNIAKLFLYIVNGGIIIYLMNDVVTGTLLVGTFVFLLGRFADLRNNLVDLFYSIGVLYSDNNFLNDVFDFLDKRPVIKNGKIKLKIETPRIEFKKVSFKYPETEKKILEDLELVIAPGEKVAIVGVNGAGKTTFTKTLMRFYDVSSGEILIDGKKIKDVDINTFYEKLGYLPQDYARYRLTVAEAISISDPYRKYENQNLKNEEIIEASKKAGSHEFIMGLEKGYYTQLGKEFEGGVEPSVGQWQKLALARLFYKNPQVWILDEPTASIDAIAEIEIFNELEKLPKDKTVILISHRFNTVKNADKIIVIEHGKIAEMGSHNELMNIQDGHYKNLFNSQKDSYN